MIIVVAAIGAYLIGSVKSQLMRRTHYPQRCMRIT
jgi:hypothetical protein